MEYYATPQNTMTQQLTISNFTVQYMHVRVRDCNLWVGRRMHVRETSGSADMYITTQFGRQYNSPDDVRVQPIYTHTASNLPVEPADN